MLPRHRRAVCFVLASTCTATLVYAMGGKHPATGDIGTRMEGWPATLPAAINSPGRIAGHWVNANDEFFYRGDNKAFGEFLGRLAETKLPLTLVLHTTPHRRSCLWGDEPREPYDWSLLVGSAGWVDGKWKLNFDDPSTRFAVRVDVWIDGAVLEDHIDLPAGIRVSIDRGQASTAQPSTQPTMR